MEIQLPRSKWQYDPYQPLGSPGGFGAVYVGSGNGHDRVAIKKLHVAAGAAEREMKIAEELAELSLNYIVPVYDSGQDAISGSYFVVMACAGESLQEKLSAQGKFVEQEAVAILLDIAQGLEEAEKIVVHRDLKPSNVLRHEERWKIADFGIARFVEDSTATNTLKDSMTLPYAAPEQWKREHATPATDIYALGCIGYALLTGRPPFPGPTPAELRDQHLTQTPPPVADANPQLQSLLLMMLRKQPGTRISIGRVASLLRDIAQLTAAGPPSAAFQALAHAGSKHAVQTAQVQAGESEAVTKTLERSELADAALDILQVGIIESLFQKISQAAPTAQRLIHDGIALGTARLEFDAPPKTAATSGGSMVMLGGRAVQCRVLAADAFSRSRWDVVTQARLTLFQDGPKNYEWSANLYYMKRPQDDGYRWWEVQFMTIFSGGRAYEPFAYDFDEWQEADVAASTTMTTTQLGNKPKPVDDEMVDDFHDRWMKLLAEAVEGRLARPNKLPLD